MEHPRALAFVICRHQVPSIADVVGGCMGLALVLWQFSILHQSVHRMRTHANFCLPAHEIGAPACSRDVVTSVTPL